VAGPHEHGDKILGPMKGERISSLASQGLCCIELVIHIARLQFPSSLNLTVSFVTVYQQRLV
jgi:hypothetical protein